MSTSRIKGVLAPVLTPFSDNYQPDTQRFIQHCKWLISQQAGLAIFGTNSEANSLSLTERLNLLDALLNSGVDPKRIMPGTGCCAIPETIELTRKAVEAGCSGVLMLPPFYYKNVSDEGLFRAYAEIIERVGNDNLRIYLYHIPPIAQVPITMAVIERLLKNYPTIIAGIKDSSGDWNNTEALLNNFQSETFDVFCGSEVFLLQNLRKGGAGCITATGNVNPAMIHHLYQHWQDDNADQLQAEVTTVRRTFEILPLISGMKSVIAWQRNNDTSWQNVRPPLVEASAQQAEQLKEKLESLNFSMPNVN